jgi:hypothetical protein
MALGFGRRLDEMHSWLKVRVGLADAVDGFNAPGVPEASLWYFRDVETAREFVDRFGCTALVVEER